ncbi:hypothetical protein QE152_g11244 [Popillia japonica]|uniref:Uncharacterized protein n=1 Tax=Popillia japonica TaxID=7064 RepID=A0AAW1LSQ2_POPJA
MTNDTYRKLVDNAANDSDCGYCANDVQEMRPGMRRKQHCNVTQNLFTAINLNVCGSTYSCGGKRVRHLDAIYGINEATRSSRRGKENEYDISTRFTGLTRRRVALDAGRLAATVDMRDVVRIRPSSPSHIKTAIHTHSANTFPLLRISPNNDSKRSEQDTVEPRLCESQLSTLRINRVDLKTQPGLTDTVELRLCESQLSELRINRADLKTQPGLTEPT